MFENAQENLPIVNHARIHALKAHLTDSQLKEVIEIYLSEAKVIHLKLIQALYNEDWLLASNLFHQWKGAALSIGLDRLGNWLQVQENCANKLPFLELLDILSNLITKTNFELSEYLPPSQLIPMKKILIAEDSLAIQKLTKNIFQNQGFEITTARNGEQVLEIMKEETFDAILLDIVMPVLDGITTAKRIRDLEANPGDLPLIAITGNPNNYTEHEYFEFGFDRVMQKPINFDVLLKWVIELTHSE
jgi:two-component system cell cycle response regulator DivK